MMRKVAVLADIHLPERTDTVKEIVFDWALAEAKRQGVDMIACAGDMTSMGTLGAARRLFQKLTATGLPFLNALGNAELRTASQRADILEMMNQTWRIDNVIALDTSRQTLSEESRECLLALEAAGEKNLLALAHCPIFSLSVDEQVWIDHFIETGVIGCLISGHKHHDSYEERYPIIRGLDPDKAIGGAPCLVIMTRNGESWERQDIPCPLAQPTSWEAEIRDDFLSYLGISCMGNTKGSLESAIAYRIPSLEIRYSETLRHDIPELLPKLNEWRQNGGKYLSLHIIDVLPDGNGDFKRMELVRDSAQCAAELGCQTVTLHAPGCHEVGKMVGNYKSRLLSLTAQALMPLKDAGITIGVENLHMQRDQKIDSHRGYGYTPEECRSWIESLKKAMDYDNIGFHLDIGHARNNSWYASRFNISEWYAEMGQLLTGCHIHQVMAGEDGKIVNHCPMKSLYGQYISMSSFLMAWKIGQLKHVPMYLEISREAPLESWIALNQALCGE